MEFHGSRLRDAALSAVPVRARARLRTLLMPLLLLLMAVAATIDASVVLFVRVWAVSHAVDEDDDVKPTDADDDVDDD